MAGSSALFTAYALFSTSRDPYEYGIR
eukprot:COSAG01_NODE_42445_length_440_cov_0.642229_1_plen_26_part_10